MKEFMAKLYPAFSRRATQVVILSSALERIERGCSDAQQVARDALDAADPFDWKARAVGPKRKKMTTLYMPAMEAADFARWAAEALHRAGWNTEIVIQRSGEAHCVTRGEMDRYTADELEAARKAAIELHAQLKIE